METEFSWKEKLRKHHTLIMMLGCAIPIGVALFGKYYLGWQQSYLIWAFLLLCPLMHYWMMKEMHGKEHRLDDTSSGKEKPQERKPSCH